MFVACGIWCLADVSSVSPSSEQTELKRQLNTISHRRQTYHINLVDQTHIKPTKLYPVPDQRSGNHTLNYNPRWANPINSIPRCRTKHFKNSSIVAGMKAFNGEVKFK